MFKVTMRFLIVMTIVVVAATSGVFATAPSKVSYQGILTDSNGDPEVGTYEVIFALYGVGLTPLWAETLMVKTDSLGRFNVVLGETDPLDASYFGFGERSLGITVESDAEMPRQALQSVPYALRVQTVDGASGGQILGNIILLGDILMSGEIDASGMSSKIRFHYNSLGDLPDATTYHGAVAHVHDEGRLYFAHGGVWVPLANADEITLPSAMSAADGDPDSVVIVDSEGNVCFAGVIKGKDSALVVGDSGLIVNGPVYVGGPLNANGIVNINNGARVIGGDLNVIGPRLLRIQNAAQLRVLNGAHIEMEPASTMAFRSTSELRVDAGTVWTSSAELKTDANIDIEDPGFLHVHNSDNTAMSTLEYNELTMGGGLSTMELRVDDLTHTGTQFDINASKLVVNTPVPVEMLSLDLTGGSGLSVAGGGGVSITGGGTLSTDAASSLVVNGPSTFNQPINAPLQVGVGAPGAGQLHVVGSISATGPKLFIQDHPTDPTREVRYIALEGGEAGTYARGSGLLINGSAVVDLPEHFALVTSESGVTAQITPRDRVNGMLYIERVSTTQLVVKASHDADTEIAFDYLVQGVRLGYENHQPIQIKPALTLR